MYRFQIARARSIPTLRGTECDRPCLLLGTPFADQLSGKAAVWYVLRRRLQGFIRRSVRFRGQFGFYLRSYRVFHRPFGEPAQHAADYCKCHQADPSSQQYRLAPMSMDGPVRQAD